MRLVKKHYDSPMFAAQQRRVQAILRPKRIVEIPKRAEKAHCRLLSTSSSSGKMIHARIMKFIYSSLYLLMLSLDSPVMLCIPQY